MVLIFRFKNRLFVIRNTRVHTCGIIRRILLLHSYVWIKTSTNHRWSCVSSGAWVYKTTSHGLVVISNVWKQRIISCRFLIIAKVCAIWIHFCVIGSKSLLNFLIRVRGTCSSSQCSVSSQRKRGECWMHNVSRGSRFGTHKLTTLNSKKCLFLFSTRDRTRISQQSD